MTKSAATKSREQKLAAKLKENLRRRKAQARARTSSVDEQQSKNTHIGQSRDVESDKS